jgi:hypothetical protein
LAYKFYERIDSLNNEWRFSLILITFILASICAKIPQYEMVHHDEGIHFYEIFDFVTLTKFFVILSFFVLFNSLIKASEKWRISLYLSLNNLAIY